MSYKELKSYQQATTVYDLTVEFCDRYVRADDRTNRADKTHGPDKSYRSNRTTDQMVQAARSGKQNIVEGSAASRNNPKEEVFLLGVARASFQELLEDYEDFLRQRSLRQWGKDDPRALAVRRLAYKPDRTDRIYKTDRTDRTYRTDTDRTDGAHEVYRPYLGDPEMAANALITLINQTNFLLDKQLPAVRNQHEKSGAVVEPHNQKVARIMADQRRKEEEFDQWLKQFLPKKGPIGPIGPIGRIGLIRS